MSRLVLPAAALLALVFGTAVRAQFATADAAAAAIPQEAVAARIAALQGAAIQVQAPGAPAIPPDRQIPVGTARISGTVTAADTGRPLRRARVMIVGPSAVPVAARGGRAGVPIGVARGDLTLTNSAQPTGMILNRSTVTDAQGQFVFDHLPAGQFMVSASAAQYLTTNYGQKRPSRPGTPIDLADGQRTAVTVSMIRSSVITGMVRGEDGDAMTGAQVRALLYTRVSGVRRLVQTAAGATDDRGIYRLIGLQPGEYVIAVTPSSSDAFGAALTDPIFDEIYEETARNRGSANPMTVVTIPGARMSNAGGPPAGYAPTYYPGTATVSPGSSIALGAGEERSGVDLQALAIRAVNVNGIVLGYSGSPNGVQVSLVSDDPAADGLTIPSVRVGSADGKFTLRNVAPGQYTLIAQTVPIPRPANVTVVNGSPVPVPAPPSIPTLDDSERLWARASMTVDGQTNPLISISMQAGRSISGSVAFDMASPPDLSRAQIYVTLTVAPGSATVLNTSPRALVGTDGRFALRGVIPGRYIVRSTGGLLKSSIVNGEDTLDFPLVVTGSQDYSDAVLTITDSAGELSGILSDVAGKPAVDYTVVIAPMDQRFWTPGSRRVFTMRPGTNGQFSFRNLPAGDYFIAAVTDIEQGEQFDPEFLRTLMAASARVTLSEGAKVMQNLRVAR